MSAVGGSIQPGRTQGTAGTQNANWSLIGNTIESVGKRNHGPKLWCPSFANAHIAERSTESRWLQLDLDLCHGFHATGRTVYIYERILDRRKMNKRIAQFLAIPFVVIVSVLTAVILVIWTIICFIGALPSLVGAGVRRVFR